MINNEFGNEYPFNLFFLISFNSNFEPRLSDFVKKKKKGIKVAIQFAYSILGNNLLQNFLNEVVGFFVAYFLELINIQISIAHISKNFSIFCPSLECLKYFQPSFVEGSNFLKTAWPNIASGILIWSPQ